MNTAIIAMAQGLGFAIPSNTVEWVLQEVMTHGGVRRRQLGIVANVTRLPRATVRELDLLADQGVVSNLLMNNGGDVLKPWSMKHGERILNPGVHRVALEQADRKLE